MFSDRLYTSPKQHLLNQAFSPDLPANTSFTYNGYFVNPLHDTRPNGGNVAFPGGSVVVTSNSGQSGSGIVWGLVELELGGTLFAYDPNLNVLWCTNSQLSSYCQNTNYASAFTTARFALPTVVNGYVYIPTAGITSSSQNSSCATSTCSGVLVYSGH